MNKNMSNLDRAVPRLRRRAALVIVALLSAPVRSPGSSCSSLAAVMVATAALWASARSTRSSTSTRAAAGRCRTEQKENRQWT